jgi:peptide/nickel transport system substrate-binding protein
MKALTTGLRAPFGASQLRPRFRPALCLPVALIATAALGLAGCGGGSPAAASSGKIITVGTTDKVTSFDPAEGYSSADVTVLYSVYQGLLYTPPGQTKPVPQVARSCSFNGPMTYSCTIRSGLRFSNGQPLTAADVQYSIDRALHINNPNGGAYLLAPLKDITLQGSNTVVFHLKIPDATWPFVLSSPAALIVPQRVFPATSILASNKVVGSGPYVLAKYVPGQIAELKPNPDYTGPKVKNAGIDVVYYQDATTMAIALKSGEIDSLIAWRSLAPTDLAGLKSDPRIQIVSVPGVDGRYLDFNLNATPVKNVAIRKAIALLINREAIANDVFQGTVQPLYSLVPNGIEGATTPYASLYGTSPNPSEAKAVLAAAHVKTPISLTLWYTPSHYGSTSADEYAEIQRDLEVNGLFQITLKSTEYLQYQNAINAGSYQGFQVGWYPDYADADDYLQGLLNGGWKNSYSNSTVTKLLATEEGETDQSARDSVFAQIQNIVAQDVALVPVYQTNYIIAARQGISGIKPSLNILFLIQFANWSG